MNKKKKLGQVLFLVGILMIVSGILMFVDFSMPVSILLEEEKIVLVVGEKYFLNISNQEEKSNYQWTSSDESVAIVSESGEIEAIGSGRAIIEVKYKGTKASCEVFVDEVLNIVQAEKITLNHKNIKMQIGEEVRLEYEIKPSNVTNKEVSWYSSNEDVIVLEDGKVISKNAGEAVVTVVTSDGKTDTCDVVVVGVDGEEVENEHAIEVEGIMFDVSEVTIKKGEVYLLNYIISPKEASTTVIWNSSDNNVISISGDGMLLAKGIGSVVVTANTLNGKSSNIVVNVVSPVIEVESIELNKKDSNVVVGEKLELSANILPIDVTDKTVSWSSSNSDIASVSSNGVVSTKKTGVVVITAKSANGKSATCKISVVDREIAVTGISLNKTSASIEVGEVIQLSEIYSPSNATVKNVTWSSSDSTIASVDSFGVVTGKKAGDVIITAKTSNGKSATCKVSVTTPFIEVSGVVLSKAIADIEVGSSLTLTATVYPNDATVKAISWSSSDSTIATVSDSGVVTGKKAGDAIITVKTSNGKSATCKISVANSVVNVTSITLNKTTADIKVGSTVSLNAMILPSNATNKTVIWSSSDSTIATVSDSGVVSGKKAGDVIITAKTSNGKSATCKVSVTAPVIDVTSITLNKTTADIKVGSTVLLTATILPSNATDKTITWSSSDSTIATVSSSGVVTGRKAGNVTVTAKTSNGKSATCKVSVTNPVIDVTSITLNKTTADIEVGSTVSLTATILPSNATDETITWSSSDSTIATVSASGVVTGKKEGTVTITVKTSNGKSATCKVIVKDNSSTIVESIAFNKSMLEMKVGEESSIITTFTANNLNINNASITIADSTKAKIISQKVKNNTIEANVQCLLPGTTTMKAIYNTLKKEIAVNCTEDKVVEEKVSISFNSVGGSSVATITAIVNKAYPSLPSPTRSGYKFLGWYTSLDYNKKVDSNSLVDNSSHTLYAKWELNSNFTYVSYPDTVRSISLAAAKSHLSSFPEYERTYTSQKGTSGIEVFNSPYYTVKANNNEISSYATVAYVPSLSKYVFHSFSTMLVKSYPLTIEVTSNIDVTSATIYPTSLGTTIQIDDNKMTFTVTKAAQYTLVINGSQEYAYTLFVEDFIDEDLEIEKYRQQYGTNNVKVYDSKFYAVDYISLQSNSVLYLKSGAYLVANHKYDINSEDDEKLYEETTTGNRYAFIDCYGKKNVKIIGHGLIDLSKLDWHERNAMKISQPSDIEVRGITFVNSPNWTLYTYIVNNMTINNVKVFGYRSNSDAYAIANSKNVTITSSFARSGDDLYLVRNMGAGIDAPTDNITVDNCIAWAKERAFGIVSSVYFDMTNVTFKNSAVIFKDQTDTDWSKTRIASLAVIYSKGSGIIDNITFDNILITKDNGRPIIVNVVEENGLTAGSLTNKKITNIKFKNIRYNSTYPVLIDSGNNTNYISTSFENVKSGSTLITNSNYNNYVVKNNNVSLTIK